MNTHTGAAYPLHKRHIGFFVVELHRARPDLVRKPGGKGGKEEGCHCIPCNCFTAHTKLTRIARYHPSNSHESHLGTPSLLISQSTVRASPPQKRINSFFVLIHTDKTYFLSILRQFWVQSALGHDEKWNNYNSTRADQKYSMKCLRRKAEDGLLVMVFLPHDVNTNRG